LANDVRALQRRLGEGAAPLRALRNQQLGVLQYTRMMLSSGGILID
jgi:hypothetical protein